MMNVKEQARAAALEIIEKGKLKAGQILVVGCSSSEVCGDTIGKNSSLETAEKVFAGIYEACCEKGIFPAAQCCEHLNRAIITERAAVPGADICNVVPQPKAGGSFATTAYKNFKEPVAVEKIRADAGLDIGDTFIGMHMKEVCVPVRLSIKEIGKAHLTACRVRPKFIGGRHAPDEGEVLFREKDVRWARTPGAGRGLHF